MVALISPRSCKSDVRQGPCFLIPLRRRLPPPSESTIPSDFSRGNGWGGGEGKGQRLTRLSRSLDLGPTSMETSNAVSPVEENCNNRLSLRFLFEKFDSIGEIILGINFHHGVVREKKGRGVRESFPPPDIDSQLHLIRRVSTEYLIWHRYPYRAAR